MGARLFVLADQVAVLPEAVVVRVLEVRDDDPLLGGGDRRLEVAGPGPRAEALGERFEAADRAADREAADPLAVAAAVGARPFRKGVEGVGGPGGGLEVEAGHGAEVRDLVGVLDVLEEDGGHKGVRRVAAVLEHPERGLGDVRKLGRHHGVFRGGHRLGTLVQERIAGVALLLGETEGHAAASADARERNDARPAAATWSFMAN